MLSLNEKYNIYNLQLFTTNLGVVRVFDYYMKMTESMFWMRLKGKEDWLTSLQYFPWEYFQ